MEDVGSDADDDDKGAHDSQMSLQLLVRRGLVRPSGKPSQEHLSSLPPSLAKTLAVDRHKRAVRTNGLFRVCLYIDARITSWLD